MVYAFGEYELDTRRLELRRAGEPVRIEPQVFDVLALLIEHRDRVVPRREILQQVWGHGFVSDATLSSRLKTARRAIGDSGAAQALIRTVHGRGYRFVGEVRVRPAETAVAVPALYPPTSARHSSADDDAAAPLVGRAALLDELGALLAAAAGGARRIAFVGGETGIGKSALVEAFLAHARASPGVRVALGQCLDQRGHGEPYLPVLDALGRMCRAVEGGALVELLRAAAPAWLAQLPGVVSADEAAALEARTRGATRERMLRQAVAALEAWAAERPLVLALEDLHWSDPSTLQLVDCLARRHEPARLLLLATYRPAEVRVGGHPLQTLVQELRVRNLCGEISVGALDPDAARAYLALRFPDCDLDALLAPTLHARTEGNPLFMRGMVDAWVAAGGVERTPEGWRLRAAPGELADAVPETLERLVQQQVERLDPGQRAALEAGSVAGREFSAAATAAGLGVSAAEADERCQALARQGRFLERRGEEEWPDGTFCGRYAFIHHLHRDVVYRRVSPGLRTAYHRLIGERLVGALGASAATHAAELALHFTEGRDGERAVEFLIQAGEQALARSAHAEAVEHLTRALGVLREHPDVPRAVEREISILRRLGSALVAVRGWNEPEAELAFGRARELCERTGDTAQLARVLYGLAYLHELRGEYPRSQSLVEERLRLDVPGDEPGPAIESYELLSCTLFHQGAFTGALRNARRGMALFRTDEDHALPADLGEHAGVACYYWAGLTLWFLGRAGAAEESLRTAVRLAERAQHLYMLAMAQGHLAQLYQLRREPHRVASSARDALALAESQGYPFQRAIALGMLGWAQVMEGDAAGGVERIRAGLQAEREIGAAMERPYFLGVLADALAHAGRTEEGLRTVDEALERVRDNGRAFFWQAELHRLRGTLLLQTRGRTAEAEAALREAQEVARRQGALALELRALLSLSRPPLPRDTRSAARAELRQLLPRFREGLDTPDLRAAHDLLHAPAPAGAGGERPAGVAPAGG
jgi:DNA-binding winged helix-turn-helix (wHTH) protein/predicted ATPase